MNFVIYFQDMMSQSSNLLILGLQLRVSHGIEYRNYCFVFYCIC